jgi:hypothetical protein
VEHEDELINQRIQRLILSHGALLSAGALIVTRIPDPAHSRMLLIVAGIALAGIVLAALQYLAIDAAFLALKTLEKKWGNISRLPAYALPGEPLPGLTGGGCTKAHGQAN